MSRLCRPALDVLCCGTQIASRDNVPAPLVAVATRALSSLLRIANLNSVPHRGGGERRCFFGGNYGALWCWLERSHLPRPCRRSNPPCGHRPSSTHFSRFGLSIPVLIADGAILLADRDSCTRRLAGDTLVSPPPVQRHGLGCFSSSTGSAPTRWALVMFALVGPLGPVCGMARRSCCLLCGSLFASNLIALAVGLLLMSRRS